jgi:acyl carrier protein phosphodiesterase
LSGPSEELIIGNFIADFVKGSQLERFSPGIAEGIRLHRKIDSFTDAHPVVKLSKQRLAEKYRKYSPVIVDIFYDHLLAADWKMYCGQELGDFAAGFYDLARSNWEVLPEKAKHMLPYMIRYNWLVSYSSMEGIRRALTGLSRRASFVSGMEKASEDLELYYEEYRGEFRKFFDEIRPFAEAERRVSRGDVR